jgi:hypothetical protein
MTWSYSGNPADSDKDAVRFWSGDTNLNDKLVDDEEVLFVLASQPNVILAAADILDALAIRFSGDVNARVGDVQENASDRAKAYKKRADELRSGKGPGQTMPEWFFGGQSRSGKDSLRSNEDAVQPTFTEGQDDNPRADDHDNDDWRHRC